MPRACVTASEHFLLMGLLFRLLYNRYIDGAGTLISLFDIEANPLTFIKCPESGTLDRTIMDENVTAFVTLDKAKTLFLVEPLHFTFCQSHTLLSRNFSWLGPFAKKTKKPLWPKFLLQPLVVTSFALKKCVHLTLPYSRLEIFPVPPKRNAMYGQRSPRSITK